jgi:tetratricopeptide (TPR) repeat protein
MGGLVAAWLLLGVLPGLVAADALARAEFSLGHEQLQAGDAAAAGRHFDRAKFLADDPVLKANALKAAAAAFRQAGDPIREAAALRELTANFAGHADYVPAMRRQYELASRDYRIAVHRGGSWFPWHGQAADRAIEAYESILGQAQFAEFTPELRVRLGRLYLEKNRIPEALRQWRDVTRLYPGGPEERLAWFELANALLQLAERGDGDGVYGREAQEVMHAIVEKYPDDPDTVWAREKIRNADTFAARRLYDLARFYRGTGNDEASVRYLHELLSMYPQSPVASEAEVLLGKVDASYVPPARPVAGRHHRVSFPMGKLPEEPVQVLVPAGESGKWLLPVEELGIEDWRRPVDPATAPVPEGTDTP